MAIPFLMPIDLNKNEIQNVKLQKLATDPSPDEALFYYNTTDKRAKFYNGTAWVYMDDTDSKAKLNLIAVTQAVDLDAIEADTTINNTKVSNANHTGDVTGATALTITNNVVTNAKLAQVATATIKGRATAATGNVEDLTPTQVRAMLNVADGANAYTHPTGDGNLHVPATGTTNNDKILTAGSTAGSLSWAVNTPAWANVTGKPSSTPASIDSTVANSHTHSNKALLDSYTQTEANLASAVSLKHNQNTDTGTNSSTFAIGPSGPKLKNSGGELQVRNNADTAYADLRVANLIVEGTTTIINSNTLNIGDNEIELNSDITTSTANSDGGITVKRLMADNTTRKDAKLTFNNSTGKWETTGGAVAGTLVTAQIANKATANVGDGTNTSYVITHNLNSQDLTVAVREVASPYSLVYTDIEFTSVNSITVKFASAPSSNQYRVTIVG